VAFLRVAAGNARVSLVVVNGLESALKHITQQVAAYRQHQHLLANLKSKFKSSVSQPADTESAQPQSEPVSEHATHRYPHCHHCDDHHDYEPKMPDAALLATLPHVRSALRPLLRARSRSDLYRKVVHLMRTYFDSSRMSIEVDDWSAGVDGLDAAVESLIDVTGVSLAAMGLLTPPPPSLTQQSAGQAQAIQSKTVVHAC
jgi:hypothetical protein